MRSLEDKLIDLDGVVDKERIKERYLPLKDALKQVENQLATLEKPSNHLKDAEIQKVLYGMAHMGDLYTSFNPIQKKQFLKFFIEKVYLDKVRGIVDIKLIPEFEELISGDLVRISSNWLPRVDSNH